MIRLDYNSMSWVELAETILDAVGEMNERGTIASVTVTHAKTKRKQTLQKLLREIKGATRKRGLGNE